MAIPFELYYNIENDIELIEEAEEYGTAVPSPRASHESQNHVLEDGSNKHSFSLVF